MGLQGCSPRLKRPSYLHSIVLLIKESEILLEVQLGQPFRNGHVFHGVLSASPAGLCHLGGVRGCARGSAGFP